MTLSGPNTQNQPLVAHPDGSGKMVTKAAADGYTRRNTPEALAARAAKAAAKEAAGGQKKRRKRKRAYFGGKWLVKKATSQNKKLVVALGPQVKIKKEKQQN